MIHFIASALSAPFFSKSRKFWNLSVAFLLLASIAGATNSPIEKAQTDFKKVNDLYAATASYSLDIRYSVFDNHAGGNLVEQKSGKYLKHGALSYSKVLDVETIINPKRTLIVNHEDKFIVITDTKKIELSPLQTDAGALLKLCSSIEVEEQGTSVRHYTLNFSEEEGNEFSKIEVFINLSDYSLKKMILYYNQEMPLDENDYYAKEKKPRLEIVYTSFKPVTSLNPSFFEESAYLSENPTGSSTNVAYKGKGKCATYEIINQLQSVRFRKK
jgi:hypothetical protein